MIKKLPILVIVILLFSCSNDDDGIKVDLKVDLNDFEVINSNYPYSEIQPAVNFTYLELIQANFISPEEENEEFVLFSLGKLCSEAACIKNFGKIKAERGFAPNCLPGSCFNYLKVQNEDELTIVDSKDGLLDFFGTIDTPGEALLWARVNSYYWKVNTIEDGAYKEVEDGFELIVRQTVKFCEPVQTDRFHIKISADGTINILEREVAEVLENACV